MCFFSRPVSPFIAWDALLRPRGVPIQGQTWISTSQRFSCYLVVQRVPQERCRSSSQHLRHGSQSRCTLGFPLENPRTKYMEGEPAGDNVSAAVPESHKFPLVLSVCLTFRVNCKCDSLIKFVGHQDGDLTDGSRVTFTLGDVRSTSG